MWALFLGTHRSGSVFNTSGHYSLVFVAGGRYLTPLGAIPWYLSLGFSIEHSWALFYGTSICCWGSILNTCGALGGAAANIRRYTCSHARKHTPCALKMQPLHTAHIVPPYSLNVDSVRYKAVPVSPNAAPRRFKCMWTCATARARAVTARAR